MRTFASGIRAFSLRWRVGIATFLFVAVSHASAIDFAHEVAPVLRKHCVECHGGGEAKGGFSINTRELFLDDDSAVPGNPAKSYFLELIRSGDPDDQMPPAKKPRLSSKEAKTLENWVREGMPWDPGFTFAERTYEPPLKPRRPKIPPALDGRDNPIDRILDAWLAERNAPRPKPIDDARFLRRVSLDLVGLLPTLSELDAFVADKDPEKRVKTIRRLLADDVGYADHWLTFWNDLLRNDYTGTGFITGGRKQISAWLYEALVSNMPFDRFLRELIAPTKPGSRGYIDGIKWRGEVSAGQTLEIQFAQSVSQSFLGINMKCASCHDSFVDRWKLDEAYGLAAIYSTKPIEIHRCDKPVGRQAKAAWLFPEIGQVDPDADRETRLRQLADLMIHPENGRTTRTIVNRLWGQMMGRGLVHPLDAMQTEPWNADLLDQLAVHLTDSRHDLKAVLELIATSEAYQSGCEVVQDDPGAGEYNYRGPRAKRMTAEQFLDCLWQITGTAPTSFDAPIIRGKPDEAAANKVRMQAKWIWGESAAKGSIPPAGEELLLRKTLQLKDNVASGGAVMTCDNGFVLYVNGREAISGDRWSEPRAVALNDRLKKGSNQIVVRARNGGKSPNLAGFMFEARIRLENGEEIKFASGGDWQWNPSLPKSREGRLGKVGGKWSPAVVVPPKSIWTDVVAAKFRAEIARVAIGGVRMTRASLMKNDFLMRSLGRPMREQIVTSRPSELSTLEAIDLHNNEVFADILQRGAKTLSSREWKGGDDLARHLYRSALSRTPTDGELAAIREAVGDRLTEEGIEDLLWAIVLKPEFMVVR